MPSVSEPEKNESVGFEQHYAYFTSKAEQSSNCSEESCRYMESVPSAQDVVHTNEHISISSSNS